MLVAGNSATQKNIRAGGPKEKQPYAIALAGGGFMALAGLWENWKSPAGEWVRSFTILTCTPNELRGQIYNRMPAILPRAAWPSWLGEDAGKQEHLKAVLRPPPGGRYDVLARERPRRQRQEQRSVAD